MMTQEERQSTGFMGKASRSMWKIVVAAVGFAVLAAGVIMLVLPGPGLVVILLSLVVLATQFSWAKHLLDSAAAWVRKGRKVKKRSDLH
jgi:uncharacterized protein (TIGR02611 family)